MNITKQNKQNKNINLQKQNKVFLADKTSSTRLQLWQKVDEIHQQMMSKRRKKKKENVRERYRERPNKEIERLDEYVTCFYEEDEERDGQM